MLGTRTGLWIAAACASFFVAGCSGGGGIGETDAESCMVCHNGSTHDDYAGPGLENPHPFPGAAELKCTECHGGNPDGDGVLDSHVPPPPEIGDDANLVQNRHAYFNRLTLTGIDKFPDYTVQGKSYTALEYLQFVNPGDLRVVTEGQSCGKCHSGHAECVADSLLATEAGVLSGALYAAGVDSEVPESVGLYQDTAVDKGFRARTDEDFQGGEIGAVPRLLEFPVFSVHGDDGPNAIHNNDDYLAAELSDDREADNQLVSDSSLARLYHEQIAFTCGDCHLGSAGANNRAGDFRSSGCTSCHMRYSLSGRTGSKDPNVNRFEPLDPDDIEEPERPHVRRHRIDSVAKTLPDGTQVKGIDDYSCAGCHQGSNRTVMQFWGIRLDQNQDVRFGNQYPEQPASWQGTTNDQRLFPDAVGNHTFNGRNRFQYLLFEDYDGDGRDDTPADVHYEAGMGCIDCHGSYDLHGGDVNGDKRLMSHMEQSVAIRCESCHGASEAYAATVSGTTYAGDPADVAVDAKGNPLRHVVRESDGHYYLTSRLTGARHYVSQTLDVVVPNGRRHPVTDELLYSAKASFAMGRDDGDDVNTGLGPKQTATIGNPSGFKHGDSMDCASCHSAWTNNCIGCHLEGEYNTGNNFSNITGDRIVFREKNADFVYQSPVPFQLGIGTEGKVSTIAPNTLTFFKYEDRQNVDSDVFAFSDRQGKGNNMPGGYASMSHNVMMQHSIRGRVTSENEGNRYCVSCHLTEDGLAAFGSEYDTLRDAMSTGDYTALDFDFFNDVLRPHIGQNPGNQLDSPLWVHQAAGLGSGLFLFDEDGCAVNPLDDHDDRAGCNDQAPADTFDINRAFFNMDRLVDEFGAETGSNNHPTTTLGAAAGARDGGGNANMAGPLGMTLVRRLTDPITGIVLDSWLDADGDAQGDAQQKLDGN